MGSGLGIGYSKSYGIRTERGQTKPESELASLKLAGASPDDLVGAERKEESRDHI